MGWKPRNNFVINEHPLYGLNVHRTGREHLEELFAEEWAKENSKDKRTPLLASILHHGLDNTMPPSPSNRDWLIANTVIQWLGSSVGQSFLGKVNNGE